MLKMNENFFEFTLLHIIILAILDNLNKFLKILFS